MTSDCISEIQQAMVMSKLAESVECVQTSASKTKFVVLNGIPLCFRSFVLFATSILRQEGAAAYDERTLNDIRALWAALEYNFVPEENKRTSTSNKWDPSSRWVPSDEYKEMKNDRDLIKTIKWTIIELARRYSGQYEETDYRFTYGVNFKPLMTEIYNKFTDLE